MIQRRKNLKTRYFFLPTSKNYQTIDNIPTGSYLTNRLVCLSAAGAQPFVRKVP
jgi:hypothetical protein